MCWCRPEVRTPNCGRLECHPKVVVGGVDYKELLKKYMSVVIDNEDHSYINDSGRRTGFMELTDEEVSILTTIENDIIG